MVAIGNRNSINVHVRFAGSMRMLADCQNMDIELMPGETLADLLAGLADKLPHQFDRQIIQPILAAESNITILMVNQMHVHDFKSLRQPLQNGDVIVFVPPMEGG